MRTVLRRAVAAARRLREVGGILLERAGRLELVQLTNVSSEICSFELRHEDIETTLAQSRGARLVGTFHSHIASPAEPGEFDVRHALGDLMLIFDTCDRSVRLWRIEDGRAVECPFELARGKRA